jgi:metal-sulfur cluster biosynthetic enzyme
MSAPGNNDQFKDEILEALKVVRDPEIPVNVVDLGLVYHLEVSDEGAVDIEMTLTSPGCPVMDMIQADAELAAMQVDGVTKASVTFVWDPVWTTEKMTEDGKKQMRMFGFSV